MGNFFAVCLFSFGLMSSYFAIHFFVKKEQKYIEKRLFALCCLASSIWSFGFGGVFLQTDVELAYYCRSIGMIGVFWFLIFAQILICHLSEMKKIWKYLSEGIFFTGIIVYFFSVKKGEVVFYLSEWGMTYYFKPGFCNNIYTTYTVVCAVVMLTSILYMIYGSKTKRIRIFGKKFLIAEVVVVLGMVLDTIFPLIGKNAIPGSSVTQFFGLVALYHAVSFVERSRINISNMSEFIYYSLAMPVLVYDAERKLQIINDAATSFFEIERDRANIEKLKISYLFSIKEEEVFEGKKNRWDLDAICRKNNLYCNLAVSELDDGYGDTIGYLILVTDLSERMKTVAKLEYAMREAEAANQAKSTFLANMSHEIRTPMHAIIGFSELILKMEIDQEVREYVEDIKWSSHNLLAIINDILDISKIESGKMELVCGDYYVANLLNDVSLIISTQAKQKGLEFVMKVDAELPRKLYGDKVRVRGILVNLLNNAVKYTKEGTVTFEVKIIEKLEKRVKLRLSVIDTGIGIKESELENVFKSFERMDRKVHYNIEGSGLGLAIVKGFVNLMGGDVRVESVYGQGSVFTVEIEQEVLDCTPIGEAYADEAEHFGSNRMSNIKITDTHVLVVDDNQVNLKVANKALGHYGLIVDTASSGREAIELCKQNRYQMIFMDQMMPEMNGIEAMKEIRRMDPYYDSAGECKIIVLTADAISGVRSHLMNEGFDEYLGKPMNFKQLERLFVRFLPAEKIRWSEDENAVCDDEQKQYDEDVTFLKEELSDIDVEQGILNCGGTIENYLKILQIAYQYGVKQLSELRSLREQGDYKNYTIKVHSMKSTALNMGAAHISDMARRQEEAGLNENYTYIDEHMEEFQSEYILMLAKIERVLMHYEPEEENTTEEEKVMLEETHIIRILGNIRQCIDEFEFTKVFEILEEIQKYQIPAEYQDAFAEISRYMEDLEVDEIREILDKIQQIEKK